MSKPRLFAIFGVLVAGVLGFVALHRSSRTVAEVALAQHEQVVQDWERLGKNAFEKLPFTPLTDFTSPGDVRSHLANTDISNVRAEDTSKIPAILDQVAGFIYARYVNTDPSAYRQWRDTSGYRRIDLDAMVKEELPPNAFEYLTGKPMPAGATLDSAYELLWTAASANPNAKPVGIASDKTGLAVVTGEITATNPQRKPIFGVLSAEVWRGAISNTVPSWWAMPTSDAVLLKQQGKVIYAEVGVILKFQSDVRYPIVFTYFWDAHAGKWWLGFINLYNSKSAAGIVY